MECNNYKIDEVDRISELPPFILHHILSLLPRKYAARTCVLSKHWNSIWDSFPILKFVQRDYIPIAEFTKEGYLEQRYTEEEYAEKFREFMNIVENSVQKFNQNKLRMQRFELDMSHVDPSLLCMIDGWMASALNNGIKELSFSVSTKVEASYKNQYPLSETRFDGPLKFYHLQKLSLKKIHLSENIVRAIIRNCPNIMDLCLWYFCGLKTLKIAELDKLEMLLVGTDGRLREIERVDIDAPNLKSFCFISNGPSLPCGINLTSCYDLKKLHLSDCVITDDLLNVYLSRFPFLEDLSMFNCNMLRTVKIYAQRLRSLQFAKCRKIETIQVNAPILSKFKYDGSNMPDLFLDKAPCPMEILCSTYSNVVSSWFLELRRFLGVSTQRKFVTLYFYKNEVNFDLEELGEVAIPPVIEVDRLKIILFSRAASIDYASLVDGPLWSCHPKTITIHSNSNLEINYIKALCEELLDREHPSCCNSRLIKCWRHDLKGAKIESLAGITDERLLHWNHLLESLTRGQEVSFKLEWDFEGIKD